MGQEFPADPRTQKSASNACAVSRSVTRSRDWASGTVSRHRFPDHRQCHRQPQDHRRGGLLPLRPVHHPLPSGRADCQRMIRKRSGRPLRIRRRSWWSRWLRRCGPPGARSMGLAPEEATIGQIMDALKRMGVDYVFDTVFSADLTIMEEASEFLERFTERRLKRQAHVHLLLPRLDAFRKDPVPRYGEVSVHGEIAPADVRRGDEDVLCPEASGVDPERIFTVSIMPCVAKKAEAGDGAVSMRNTQATMWTAVLTTRELVQDDPVRPHKAGGLKRY